MKIRLILDTILYTTYNVNSMKKYLKKSLNYYFH